GQREQAVVHAQLDLADDRQVVLEQQIVVAVDAAADGVLHRQDAVRRAGVAHRGEDFVEGRAGKRLRGGSELESRGLAVGPRLSLEGDDHVAAAYFRLKAEAT